MTDPIEVDISDETDDATLDELPSDDDVDPEPAPQPDPEQEVDLEAQAKQEAVRLRENADGSTQTEKIENAIAQAKQSLTDTIKQLQQVGQQRTQTENRIERLELTKERVRDQPDDCRVLQTLAGGVSLEVPPQDVDVKQSDTYDRGDLLDEIDETIEALEGKLDSLDETERKLEQSIEKTQGAAQRLEQAKEIIGDDDPSALKSEPYDGEMPR